MVVTEYSLLSKTMLKELRKAIRSFEFYPTFKDEIEYVLTPARVLADKEKAEYNIKKGWGLEEDTKIPTRRELHSKKQTIERLQEINVDSMLNLVQIPLNQADTNVNLFAQELKKIILAWGWNLRNVYHLFGLKNGVPGYGIVDFTGKPYKLPDGMSAFSFCKTTADTDVLSRTFTRMKEKLGAMRGQAPDPAKHFLIGLNYADRIKEDSTKFLDIIHGLEKGLIAVDYTNYKELPMGDGPISAIYKREEATDNAPMVEEQNRFTMRVQPEPELYACDDEDCDHDDDNKLRRKVERMSDIAVFKQVFKKLTK